VRYVDVGRQRRDLDGDGYADVWVRRVRFTSPGVLDLYFGPPPFTRHVQLNERGLEHPGPIDYFGDAAEAVGDVNGDGYSDLAVGCPRSHAEAEVGSVFLFLGGPAIASASATYHTWDGWTYDFGAALEALGDVNADGGSDFGVAGSWIHPQALSLFLGSAMVQPTRYELQPERDDVSLLPIAGGDLDANGYSDFFAMQTDQVASERVSGWLGAATPEQFSPMRSGAFALESGETATIVGDVNGDGFAERASFIKEFTGSPPAIAVTWGAPSVYDVEKVRWDTGIVEDRNIGILPSVVNAVNAGDINGDGLDETAVDIQLHHSSLVEVAVYFGGDGARATPDRLFNFQGTDLLFISSGETRGAGDFNGDGYDDLLVFSDWDERARVFLGGATPDTIVDYVIGVQP
jgi:hypothetical protein